MVFSKQYLDIYEVLNYFNTFSLRQEYSDIFAFSKKL